MLISELIERLTELQDVHGENAEVRLMTQQSWPFENRIAGLCDTTDLAAEDEDSDEDAGDDAPVVVYLVEGGQIGYGSKAAWDCCR